MAYDEATGQLILFSGLAVGAPNDTWNWNGTNWVQLHPVTSPPPLDGAAMAYDPAIKQIVMFGGYGPTGGGYSASTWAWTGSNWQQLAPATVPAARYDESMAWDPATQQLVMFGGEHKGLTGLATLNDTWRWTGANWVQLHPAISPGPREGAPLVFDPATGQMLLVGGLGAINLDIGTYLGDVWTWSGSTWTLQAPAKSIPPRADPVAGYDAAFNQLLLFGGTHGRLNGLNVLGDTWWWTPFAIAEPFLPPGTAGEAWAGVSGMQLDAVAGSAPFVWSVAAGALPPGMVLEPGGVLIGTPQTPGRFSFTVSVSDSAGHSTSRAYTVTINPTPLAGIWVSDATNSVLRAYALRASGNASPTVTLSGSLSQLNGPDGLVLDATGGLYVANGNTASVNYYTAGASGTATPTRVISGPFTGLALPAGMALDSAGRLYVANEGASTVTVYAAGANGNQVPVQTIGGLLTGLRQPSAVTIDATGHLWVSDLANNSLSEFPANASGDVAPLAQISGPDTLLNGPVGLAQDARGQVLIVSNLYGQSITEYYQTGPFGDVSPGFRTFNPLAQVNNPEGLDVDAGDELYVANEFGGVNEYHTSFAMEPFAILAGPATGLRSPRALTVAPPMQITTRSLPGAGLGRRYSSGVFAVLGSPPLRWRLVHGRLPVGLRLTRSGRITGVSRHLGTYKFTVEVKGALKKLPALRRRLTLAVRRVPTVTTIGPARGRDRGGTLVTITGTGFASARGQTIVRFGRFTALRTRCRSHTTCTARAPAHASGRVTVTVTVTGLTSAPRSADSFTYTP
ncbi:MAG TPA: putative Ig domain-containing protein [Solirubrobacteraceae bacterium]|nr:putative Ig domain-containing protein [Solirubrobacteraceae bacterium]